MAYAADAPDANPEQGFPQSGRDFQKAALQRLTVAEFLLENNYNLDAMYLGGYTIECALKALILEMTPEADRPARLNDISRGSQMHDPEELNKFLKDMGKPIPTELVTKIHRFEWSTNLRYATGRTSSSETRGFLKLAKEIYDWVERARS